LEQYLLSLQLTAVSLRSVFEAEADLNRFGQTSAVVDNSIQELQLRDYLDILQRRKLWILLTALGVFVMGLVVAIRLPNLYHSETTIVVDPQQISDSLVSSSAASSVLDRLSTIRQFVMSPTRLADLVNRLDLYPRQSGHHNIELIVAQMQKSINIEVADAGTQRLSAFKIGYTSRSPEQAAEVANTLASMVVEESLKARERQLSKAEEFLDGELQDTKKQLEAKEAEVSRIKTQYIMDVPESKQFHLEVLDNLRSQLRSSQDRVSRDQTEKVYLQSMLANSNPVIDIDANNGEGSNSPLQSQIEKLESSLVELRARYGANYPDVRKLQSQLDGLKAKKAQEDANTPKRDVSAQTAAKATKNPVVASQLAKLEREIADQLKVQEQLNEQINVHITKLEQMPIFEGRMAGLMRDYDSLRAHYNGLLDRKISAGMASNLENHQKAERFTTLDAAKVADKPSAPNRPLIAIGALLAGLIAGLGVAVVVDLTDGSVRSEKEAARILGVPVLGGIPVIVSPSQLVLRRARIGAAVAATIFCSAIIGFVITIVSERIG
jgi:succinoglycan biosynthesis transport protein ExoP